MKKRQQGKGPGTESTKLSVHIKQKEDQCGWSSREEAGVEDNVRQGQNHSPEIKVLELLREIRFYSKYS